MKPWRLWTIVTVLGACLMLAAAPGPAADYTWNFAGDGNWNDTTKWNPPGAYPNGIDDTAWVDNNPGANVTVSLNVSPKVNGLQVDSGDQLQFNNGQSLTLAKDSGGNQPGIANQGTISLSPALGNVAYLYTLNDAEVTLSGSGSLVLGGEGGAYLLRSGAGTGKFINGAAHTIIGEGYIQAPVDNYGTITAQGGTLHIQNPVTNLGGTGVLNINGDSANKLNITTTVTDGQINPQSGTLELNSATLLRTSLGTGNGTLTGANHFQGSLTSLANLTLGNSASLTIGKDGTLQPTITNGGTITLSPAAGYTAYLYALNDAEATFGGSGSLVLGGAGTAYVSHSGTGTGKFINGAAHTIIGEGTIGAPVDNYGTITADGGTLVMSGAIANQTAGALLTTTGSGSTLEFGGAVSSGTLTPNGGEVYVNGGSLTEVTVNDGDVSFNSGTLVRTSLGSGNGTLSGANHFRGSLTSLADLTLGNSSSLTIEKDGILQPTITNGGTITLSPATGNVAYLYALNDAEVTFGGSGSLVLGGAGTAYVSHSGTGTGKFINGAAHTIIGEGYIQAPVDNYGTITAQGGTLHIQNPVTNLGGTGVLNINGDSSNKLNISSTVIDGQINPQSGILEMSNATLVRTSLGTGSGTVSGYSYFQGSLTTQADLTLGNGTQLYIQKDGALQPTITNQGTITLSPVIGNVAYLYALNDAEVTFNGSGSLVLGGAGTAYLNRSGTATGKFINGAAHTIRGEGTIGAPVDNYGTITADGGTLVMSGAIANQTAGALLTTTGSGSTLEFGGAVSSGTLTPNGGEVYVDGGSLTEVTVNDGNVSFNNGTLVRTSLGSGNGTLSGANHFRGSLTSLADLTLGNGSSLAIEKDGTTQPTITNQGTITLSPATGNAAYLFALNDAEVTFGGSGSLVLGGAGTAYVSRSGTSTGKFINGAAHTIRGEGTIRAPVDNYGTITAQGGTLHIENPITNLGGAGVLNINGDSTNKLNISSTVTDGQINPQSGTLELNSATLLRTSLGTGSGTLSGYSYFRGSLTTQADLTLGNGTQLYIQKDGALQPTITNQGTITLNPAAGNYAYLYAYDSEATFSGGGSLVLGGAGTAYLNYLGAGSKFINGAAHTIIGEGTIGAPVDNWGTIKADGGTLVMSAAIANQTSGALLTTAGSGSTLEFGGAVSNGTLTPNGGEVYVNGGSLTDVTVNDGNVSLAGATLLRTSLGLGSGTVSGYSYFKGGLTTQADLTLGNGTQLYIQKDGALQPTITNQGTITLNPAAGNYTYLYAYDSETTFSGNGRVVLGGAGTAYLNNLGVGSKFINGAAHTIIGEGYIQAPVENHGTISAQGGTLTITGKITGDGTVSIAGSTLDLQSNDLQTGNLTMAQLGKLIVQNSRTVGLSKDFVFYQKDSSDWNWGTGTTLAMNGMVGGYGQRLEIGGYDGGYDPSLFDSNSNFNLKNLKVGDADSATHTLTFLSDWIDNGHRSSDEALYVDSLYVGAGDTLNLDNLNLYVKGYTLGPISTGVWANGGGLIIDQTVPIPLPSTVLLLGSGLLGLAGLRRRFKRN